MYTHYRLNKVFIFIYMIAFGITGCSDKIASLDEKLRRMIATSENGSLLSRIQNRAGSKVEIEKIVIKETFKQDYTYTAIVTFRPKDMQSALKLSALPKLGQLPSNNKNAGQLKVRFDYLESDDRWYFKQFM